jgi:dihydroorotate dehydrogenase
MHILNQTIECPIGNGGGTCKTIEDVEKFIKTDIPIIEIGSITEEQRDGNTGNTFYDGGNFTLNSLGLPNGGRRYYEKYLRKMIYLIHEAGKKVIVNIAGFSTEEYISLTHLAFENDADLGLLNYGCPNIWIMNSNTQENKVQQKGILSHNFETLRKTTLSVLNHNNVQAWDGRIGIKLSPLYPTDITKISEFLNGMIEVPMQHNNIGYVGFVSTMNTVPNCYAENNDGESFINPSIGLSGMAGEAILPEALGQVRQLRTALSKRIKIIGIGGIKSERDVEKMIRSGADFCQMTSHYFQNNEDVGVYNQIGADYLAIQASKISMT